MCTPRREPKSGLWGEPIFTGHKEPKERMRRRGQKCRRRVQEAQGGRIFRVREQGPKARHSQVAQAKNWVKSVQKWLPKQWLE